MSSSTFGDPPPDGGGGGGNRTRQPPPTSTSTLTDEFAQRMNVSDTGYQTNVVKLNFGKLVQKDELDGSQLKGIVNNKLLFKDGKEMGVAEFVLTNFLSSSGDESVIFNYFAKLTDLIKLAAESNLQVTMDKFIVSKDVEVDNTPSDLVDKSYAALRKDTKIIKFKGTPSSVEAEKRIVDLDFALVHYNSVIKGLGDDKSLTRERLVEIMNHLATRVSTLMKFFFGLRMSLERKLVEDLGLFQTLQGSLQKFLSGNKSQLKGEAQKKLETEIIGLKKIGVSIPGHNEDTDVLKLFDSFKTYATVTEPIELWKGTDITFGGWKHDVLLLQYVVSTAATAAATTVVSSVWSSLLNLSRQKQVAHIQLRRIKTLEQDVNDLTTALQISYTEFDRENKARLDAEQSLWVNNNPDNKAEAVAKQRQKFLDEIADKDAEKRRKLAAMQAKLAEGIRKIKSVAAEDEKVEKRARQTTEDGRMRDVDDIVTEATNPTRKRGRTGRDTEQPIKAQICSRCQDKVGTAVCSGCNTVYYCSTECQAAHWREHKNVCE
jgi:hypothetical protein